MVRARVQEQFGCCDTQYYDWLLRYVCKTYKYDRNETIDSGQGQRWSHLRQRQPLYGLGRPWAQRLPGPRQDLSHLLSVKENIN